MQRERLEAASAAIGAPLRARSALNHRWIEWRGVASQARDLQDV